MKLQKSHFANPIISQTSVMYLEAFDTKILQFKGDSLIETSEFLLTDFCNPCANF